jgi:hypothetical protein
MVNALRIMVIVSHTQRGSIDTVSYPQDMVTGPQDMLNRLQKHVFRLPKTSLQHP